MTAQSGPSPPMTAWRRLLRRRQFIVHRKLQYQLLWGGMLHMVLLLVIALAVLFVPLMVQLATHDPQTPTALRAADHLLYLHGRFWPTLILVGILVGLDTIRTSHRIAGPLFRFRVALQEARSGRIPRKIVLRNGDLLLDECEQINQAILSAEVRSQERQEARAELLASATEVRRLFGQGPSSLTPDQQEALERLLSRAESLDDAQEKAA